MTSSIVVTSESTNAIASWTNVRMPWLTASLRNSSCVAQPTINREY